MLLRLRLCAHLEVLAFYYPTQRVVLLDQQLNQLALELGILHLLLYLQCVGPTNLE